MFCGNAIRNAFGKKYEDLYEKAIELLQRFNNVTGLNCQYKDFESFQALVLRGEPTGGIPPIEDEYMLIPFVLPKITNDLTDIGVLSKYHEWLRDYRF